MNHSELPEGHVVRYEGRFLEFRETERRWEYVIRPNAKGCVAVLAVNQDQQVILTQQYRPPVGRDVIELPAGLAGDIPLKEEEPLETAARRELKEETGYIAKRWQKLFEGPSSAGMSDEFITIFQASDLTKMNEGGGVEGENIKVHLVKLTDLTKWCKDRQAEGMMVDFKIFAAVQLMKPPSEGRLWY